MKQQPASLTIFVPQAMFVAIKKDNLHSISVKYAADGSNFVIVTGPNMVR